MLISYAVLAILINLCSLSAANPGSQGGVPNGLGGIIPTVPIVIFDSSSVSENATEGKKNVTVERCRAEELSSGGAIWILLTLGTASVVHQPGSVLFIMHKGLYRLAPELGILEAVAVILLVFRGMFRYKRSFKMSVKATLALRRELGRGDGWWLEGGGTALDIGTAADDTQYTDDPRDEDERNLVTAGITASDAFDRLESFLGPLRSFSLARFFGLSLTIIAFLKACIVTGTVKTSVLAVSYGISYFFIEFLAWALLSPGPTPTRDELEAEARDCAILISLLDPYRKKIAKSHALGNSRPGEHYALMTQSSGFSGDFSVLDSRSKWGSVAVTGVGVLAALALVFWPISAPLFLLFDFTVKQKGKWFFSYSTFLVGLFWILVASLPVIGVAWAVHWWRGKDDKIPEFGRYLLSKTSWLGFYVALKLTLIVRHYMWEYTGEGTTKPDWLDWLG